VGRVQYIRPVSNSRVIALAALAAVLVGCGGDGDSDGGAASGTACPPRNRELLLGKTQGMRVYAFLKDQKNVGCQTARAIVREWGRQRIGGGEYTARLPEGWRCDDELVCRKNGSSVAFSLSFPVAPPSSAK
jgi:hypothetical protein